MTTKGRVYSACADDPLTWGPYDLLSLKFKKQNV